VDVRIIAATNRRLREEVRRGAFRADLYYRTAVVCVDIPPLRERPLDIPLLARHFASRMTDGRLGLSQAAESVLMGYDWPGNARELRNVIERAAALCRGPQINPEHIFPEQSHAEAEAVTFSEAKARWVQSFEARYATSLLERNAGNLTQAAKEAGLSRPSLYALLKRAGLATREQ
jgi:DNA-binding NtrC family response regulator